MVLTHGVGDCKSNLISKNVPVKIDSLEILFDNELTPNKPNRNCKIYIALWEVLSLLKKLNL